MAGGECVRCYFISCFFSLLGVRGGFVGRGFCVICVCGSMYAMRDRENDKKKKCIITFVVNLCGDQWKVFTVSGEEMEAFSFSRECIRPNGSPFG